jgi:hypothetical protein
MTTDSIVAPQPGAFLSESQAQRAECLRLTFALCAGRSVHIATVWAIARWLYENAPKGGTSSD